MSDSLRQSLHDDSTRPPQRGGASGPARSDNSSAALLQPVASPGLDAVGEDNRFGDYELLEEIARGGMGVVYKARQTGLNRIVALKMILAGRLASASDIDHFYSEAKAAASLNHPGIVQIYEVGEIGDQHFFSMEYVAGQTLAQRLFDGPLQPEEAAVLIANVADAVEFAHSTGLIHRDLKPANIILDSAGHPHVTDFGVAHQNDGDAAEAGTPVGTVSYMPPEQTSGNLDLVGPASDVYSLGATLYCLLAGHPPFHAANPADTLVQVVSQDPIPLRRLNDRIPIDLETITAKCLEKDPARRFQSAQELALDLRRYLMLEPIQARPASHLTRFVKWSKRSPSLALLTGVLAAAVIALGATSLMYTSLLREERSMAQASEQRALQMLGLSESLLSDLGHLRNASTVDLLQQAMSLGRLRSLIHRVTDVEARADAEIPISVFELESAFYLDADSPQLKTQIGRTQELIREWTEGPVPDELRTAADELEEMCVEVWHEKSEADPAGSDRVARIVRTQLAQIINLILTASSPQEADPLIQGFESLRRGVLPLVVDQSLASRCTSLSSAFRNWPSQQTGQQLEQSLPSGVWPWPELVD